METNSLYTVRELATKLRLPVGWLKTEAQASRLPHLKVGRKLWFNLSAVEEALSKRASTGSQPNATDNAECHGSAVAVT